MQLMQAGKLQEAVKDCKEFNRRSPGSAAGWHLASQLATRIGDHRAAVGAIDIAIELEPLNPQWQVQKAHCHIAAGEMQSARTVAGVVASRSYPRAGASSAVADLLTQLGMHIEAQKKYADAAIKEPDSALYQYKLAAALKLTGNLDDAEKHLDRAIDIEPTYTDAWVLRAGLRKQSREGNHIAGLRALLPALEDPRQKVAVLHALAKELDDIGDFNESFDALDKANQLQRDQLHYDVQIDVTLMAHARQSFGDEVFLHDNQGFDRAGALFVVGMPRSGVTLIERILGRHSVVRSIGQPGLVGNVAASQVSGKEVGPVSASVELLSAAAGLDFDLVGQAYFEASEFQRGGHAGFIDSTPENFLYAGLIHLALPRAKIIHVHRHPLDACYAIFRTQLDTRFPYSSDLSEIAGYYIAYMELMAHWQSVMPDTILQVQYEDVIERSEQTLQEMFAFCDLSWEEQCMDFLESDESEAAQKFDTYRESIDRWRNYEKQLAPVREALEKSGISIT